MADPFWSAGEHEVSHDYWPSAGLDRGSTTKRSMRAAPRTTTGGTTSGCTTMYVSMRLQHGKSEGTPEAGTRHLVDCVKFPVSWVVVIHGTHPEGLGKKALNPLQQDCKETGHPGGSEGFGIVPIHSRSDNGPRSERVADRREDVFHKRDAHDPRSPSE